MITATIPTEPSFQGTASALIGVSLAVVVWWVLRALRSEDLQQGNQWRYDVTRINELRRLDLIYRLFFPVIQLLARFNRTVFRENLPEIQRHILAAGLPRFWLAEEYLARAEVITLLFSPFYLLVFMKWLGSAGPLVAVVAMLITVWILRRRLATQAARRLQEIKRRMPFLLDLLTLLMEAGSTFLGAMRQAVSEFAGHPLSEEFGRVLVDMDLGKTRTEAFTAMRDRLADDEIASIIGSILQGEKLGKTLTPQVVLDGDPTAKLILMLADIYHEVGQYEQSWDLCTRILNDTAHATKEQKAWALFRRGRNAYSFDGAAQDVDAALVDYLAAVKLTPQAPWADKALFLAANIEWNHRHDADRAVARWRDLIRLYPNSPEAGRSAYYIGIAYQWSDRPEEAVQTLTEFVEGRPDSRFVGGAKKLLAKLQKTNAPVSNRGNATSKTIEQNLAPQFTR